MKNNNTSTLHIAKFEKVSLGQFSKDMKNFNSELSQQDIERIYNKIKLPKRATQGSAGYDFYIPFDVEVCHNQPILIPTGIRCDIANNWVLMLHIRSSLGTKCGITLRNCTGVIDSDYYTAKNEGHIMAMLNWDYCKQYTTVDERSVTLLSGDRFIQGIFQPYGITIDDNTTDSRQGGMGSTGI